MLKIKYLKFLLLLFLGINLSCSDNSIISDKEKLASLYIDLQISFEKNRGNIAEISTQREKIFRKHKVTEQQYNSTLEYYGQNKERWEDFFSIVTAQLNKMRKKV